MVQANAKVERVSLKKLDEVLSHQKSFSNRTGLGYTRESSSAANISKEVKFVKAKEPIVATTNAKKVKPREIIPKVTKESENSTLLPSLWNSRSHQTKFS